MAYELAKRPEIWQALRAELSTVPLEAQFDIDLLRALPYLNAFIRVCCTRWLDLTRRLIYDPSLGDSSYSRSSEYLR